MAAFLPFWFDPNGRQLLIMPGFNHLAREARRLVDELYEWRLLVVQEGATTRPSSLADPLAYMPVFEARCQADISALGDALARAGWRF